MPHGPLCPESQRARTCRKNEGFRLRRLGRLETSGGDLRESTVDAIRATLEAACVDFMSGDEPGAKLRRHDPPQQCPLNVETSQADWLLTLAPFGPLTPAARAYKLFGRQRAEALTGPSHLHGAPRHCCKVGGSQHYFGRHRTRRRGGAALQRL
jgi:hypothetical protein